MKQYTLSGADAFTHRPEHPERTAYRFGTGMDFDVRFQVWPSAGAMKTTLRMQGARAPDCRDWHPCKVLPNVANEPRPT